MPHTNTLVTYMVVLGNKPGERIAAVKYGETGYYLCEGYDYAGDTLDEVKARVAELNQKMGIPVDVCESMSYASLFGFDKPIAARAHEYVKAHYPPKQ